MIDANGCISFQCILLESSHESSKSKFEPDPISMDHDNRYWEDFPFYTESYDDLDEQQRLELDMVMGFGLTTKAVTASTTPAEPSPIFEDGQDENVTAQLGGKVTLHCRVTQLGDKTVSIYYTHFTISLYHMYKLTR